MLFFKYTQAFQESARFFSWKSKTIDWFFSKNLEQKDPTATSHYFVINVFNFQKLIRNTKIIKNILKSSMFTEILALPINNDMLTQSHLIIIAKEIHKTQTKCIRWQIIQQNHSMIILLHSQQFAFLPFSLD